MQTFSNQGSLSPQCNITGSDPIRCGSGTETLSGRRGSTVMLTINLTFHSTSAATSQQIPASQWLRATCCRASLKPPRPPFIAYTLFMPRKNQILSVEIIMILLITLLAESNALLATQQPQRGSK